MPIRLHAESRLNGGVWLGVGPYANTGHRAVKKGPNVVPTSLAPRPLLAAIQAEIPVHKLCRSKDAENPSHPQCRELVGIP